MNIYFLALKKSLLARQKRNIWFKGQDLTRNKSVSNKKCIYKMRAYNDLHNAKGRTNIGNDGMKIQNTFMPLNFFFPTNISPSWKENIFKIPHSSIHRPWLNYKPYQFFISYATLITENTNQMIPQRTSYSTRTTVQRAKVWHQELNAHIKIDM